MYECVALSCFPFSISFPFFLFQFFAYTGQRIHAIVRTDIVVSHITPYRLFFLLPAIFVFILFLFVFALLLIALPFRSRCFVGRIGSDFDEDDALFLIFLLSVCEITPFTPEQT